MSWRRLNAAGAALSGALWAAAETFGWVNSVALVARLSFVTQIIAFIAAWRADVPTKD